MEKFSIDYNLSNLSPSKYFVPDYELNSLLRIEFESGNAGMVNRIANTYMDDCGPNAIIEISSNQVNEEYIRRKISSAPIMEEEYTGHFDIRVEGDKLLIFFSNLEGRKENTTTHK